ncbi:MarR family winged helix-turn-helix transcriptional regulator [Actinomadura verrucosospora]|uniref:MarR family transcriptional regulator n=1 Tax=Actinomadura verrucosospora TaxID=46165 RepID=A0A7D3ZIC0_ACTVE|nr:MarR family transcriptional regulator [Actinomadura verrucosospora]QKG18863.1 MarR family transcriptional regulator [Actinomadura verrucosospora]
MEDVVAEVVRQWRAVDPGLDTSPLEVIGRITRCAALLQQAQEGPLGREGLVRPEFDVLTALRRLGPGVTPTRLARETFSSGAAVTKRVRRLQERGLVERRPDERDRRVQHLALTADGRALIDRIMPDQVAYESALLSGMPAERREELAGALAELLVVLEGRLGGLIG